ncbi:relaxase/mobilization nuclease domain-containing protein [Aquabacterium sp. J223]|uniref:relaxase/mobilization nuclease domain-containing protein n=1 Tax=Aquabacterium sp. J223 TaxID=2898431 RepID=UPI0021AE1D40|nr:relaxase/mobilization nuclease domain-containing protein [Aquabacterium sp. J223]UUX96601.1 relaxase/mobilization nuclease domain-containing protein [Aquabacterium sp. J223]
MTQAPNIDGILITWGDRLFYPGNRIVKGQPQPRLSGAAARQRAAAIRRRIEATVVRRAPQVMVKVTGGGRGMKAIAAHFRYISKNGRLEIEDQRGETMRGKDTLHDLADEWRLGGSLIPDEGEPGRRREAFNIMLSMPRGTDSASVHWAAREFAKSELSDHKYVMVLHDHQANPHVHISVRAESVRGRRLNPRKTDLHRWRETFAAKLHERGIEAEATRQATRGAARRYPELWQVKARDDGRLLKRPVPGKLSVAGQASREEAQQSWRELAKALAATGSEADQQLARSIEAFAVAMTRQPGATQARSRDQQGSTSDRHR